MKSIEKISNNRGEAGLGVIEAFQEGRAYSLFIVAYSVFLGAYSRFTRLLLKTTSAGSVIGARDNNLSAASGGGRVLRW